MKKLVTGLLAATLLAGSLPALAGPHGRDRHFRPHHYAPPVVRHHHRHGPGPVAWGLAGLALGTILYSVTPPVVAAPAVVMPPPPPRPSPGRMAYYCESYQAYYPNVQYCPEGWRALPAY